VLFNLYAFDDLHTSAATGYTPELNLQNCDFRHFIQTTMEALILVETTNLFPVPKSNAADGLGFIKSYGADKGAKITITNSIFEYSRFCKGMLVYRP